MHGNAQNLFWSFWLNIHSIGDLEIRSWHLHALFVDRIVSRGGTGPKASSLRAARGLAGSFAAGNVTWLQLFLGALRIDD